jgi:hypothetical protein
VDTKQHKSVTLDELGSSLPIGVVRNGELGKDIAVRPWRMLEEKALGEMRDKNRQINVAQFTTMVLAYMCTHLGNHDFEALKMEERRIIVSQMYLADVYYAWLYLRTQTLGTELLVKLSCPRCQSEFDFAADLGTTEVKVVEDVEDSTFTYPLIKAFDIRGKTISELIMGPARWSALEQVSGGSMDTGIAKAALIHGSVKEVLGIESLVLAPHELDNMSKIDLEKLIAQLDSNTPGPDMSLEAVCAKCNHKWDQNIDWGFDSFFGVSSR